MRPFKLFIRQIIAAKDIVLYAKNITALIQYGDMYQESSSTYSINLNRFCGGCCRRYIIFTEIVAVL